MQKKRGKGRPKKSESTGYTPECNIYDPLIEPFYIKRDQTNYTVMKKETPTRGFAGKEALGVEIEKVVGHYTSFSNALNMVAKHKFNNNKAEYSTIESYINSWEEVNQGMKTLLSKVSL